MLNQSPQTRHQRLGITTIKMTSQNLKALFQHSEQVYRYILIKEGTLFLAFQQTKIKVRLRLPQAISLRNSLGIAFIPFKEREKNSKEMLFIEYWLLTPTTRWIKAPVCRAARLSSVQLLPLHWAWGAWAPSCRSPFYSPDGPSFPSDLWELAPPWRGTQRLTNS